MFFSLIVSKDGKGIDLTVEETIARLKNYTFKKVIDYIENTNIKKIHIGARKLHLNKKENSDFAKKLFNYLI